ncbi:MAG: SMP-30/gluconolactonase/LRE family protein [Pelagimonas sp.]|uniref:SMP-30/gluconolactonase/LRE family protein n=1 Tax=Pelagimonas sp. TaxID=2073170 RepID=UPI003D6A8B45
MQNQIYDVHDPRFLGLIHKTAQIDTLWTGGRWTEGPAYFAAGRYLLWSDIPNDRVLRWDECDGNVSTFEYPCRNQNGHTVDLQGRLVSCEHRGRSVSRREHDGTMTVLADTFEGARLNSPNDVVVKSDGSIWFTDPTYGIDSDYEGDASASEIGAQNVYRIDQSGAMSVVATDNLQPNGLAFSPDEQVLYVSDTGQTHAPQNDAVIRAYPVLGETLGQSKVLTTCDVGLFDGFRVDTKGNIWSSAGDGVHCYASDGTILGKIKIDECVSNLVFGGPKKNRLFICATTSVRSIYVNAKGAAR